MDKQIDTTMIRVIKAANNMRQSDFSKAVNVSRSLIEKIEQGRMPITAATALNIRNAFDLDAKKIEHVKKAIEILTLKK
ncbi:helix-turn-helix domain-containing protein [Peribacillus frigoritolerans]|uniref:helix-turn-helix domain-containing protein n=1 Tax=Peribacillus frigoritolerans TaxID=450367 RepID=UPI003F842DB4